MNTQNTLYAIDRDLNALYHFGVKGQKKHQHDPNRRWQRQAVYANGQPDPNAKQKSTSDSGKKEGIGTRARNKITSFVANSQARSDAMTKAYLEGGPNTKGGRKIRTAQNIDRAMGLAMYLGNSLSGGSVANRMTAIRSMNSTTGSKVYGYMSRGKGTLKGAKVTPEYAKVYRKKFDEYYKEYSKPID